MYFLKAYLSISIVQWAPDAHNVTLTFVLLQAGKFVGGA